MQRGHLSVVSALLAHGANTHVLDLLGARAVARRARGQLAAYQCAAALAACTDVLALASTTDGLCVVLRWLTLLSKLASVGLLAFYPTAFS